MDHIAPCKPAHGRSLLAAGCVLIASLWLGSAALAADPRAAAAPRAATDGASWLARIQSAAQRLNYSGNFVYQQGNQLQSSRITHAWEQGTELEKLEILDGQALEYIRHNDELKCYMPEAKVVVSEKRPSGERFPGLVMVADADIESHYKVMRMGTDRVAGRSCHVTMLEPRDALRYGYRLWTDHATGLLLKAQTLNERGEVIEQVGFTEIAIGEPIERARFKPKVKSLEGWRHERLEMRPADFAGWIVKNPLPGYRKVREVRRAFADKRDVGQMVFSDGLATISVFIEAGSATGVAEGEVNRGPMNVITRRASEHWLTVMGEAPMSAIRQLANSLELNRSMAK